MIPYSRSGWPIFFAASLAGIIFLFSISGGCGAPDKAVNTLVFSPNGEWLAAGMWNGRDAGVPLKSYIADVCRTVELIRVADPSDRRIVAREIRSGVHGPIKRSTPIITFRPDGTRLTLVLWPDQAALHANLESNVLERAGAPFPEEVANIAYSPDGTLLARLWYSELQVVDLKSGQPLFTHNDYHQGSFHHTSITFSADGAMMAVDETSSRRDCVLNSRTGKPLFRIPEDWNHVRAVRLAPDGHRLALIHWNSVRILRVEPTNEGLESVAEIALAESREAVAIAFSPDGEQLACCGTDWIRVFRVADGAELNQASWSATLESLAWSGDTIATGDDEGKVTLWDAATLKRRTTLAIRGIERLNTMVPLVLLVLWMGAHGSWKKAQRDAA